MTDKICMESEQRTFDAIASTRQEFISCNPDGRDPFYAVLDYSKVLRGMSRMIDIFSPGYEILERERDATRSMLQAVREGLESRNKEQLTG